MNIHVFTFLQYFSDQKTYKTSCQKNILIHMYWVVFFLNSFPWTKKNAFYQLLILQYDAKIR